MTVIEFAEHRLAEEERQRELGADNRYDIQYWAAYLDGARAQKREYTQYPHDRMVEEIINHTIDRTVKKK